MYLIGDIGNTETKICLVNNSFKKTKKIFLNTNLINNKYLDTKLYFVALFQELLILLKNI